MRHFAPDDSWLAWQWLQLTRPSIPVTSAIRRAVWCVVGFARDVMELPERLRLKSVLKAQLFTS